MPAQSRDASRFHTGKPSADNDDLFQFVSLADLCLIKPKLIAGFGIYGAAQSSGKKPANASLITGDTRPDFLDASGFGLIHNVGISDMSTGHADEVGLTITDCLIRFFQCAETAGDDRWHLDPLGNRCTCRYFIADAFVHPTDHLRETMIVAERHIDEIHQILRLQQFSHSDIHFGINPAFSEVGGKTYTDGKILADGGFYRTHDL